MTTGKPGDLKNRLLAMKGTQGTLKGIGAKVKEAHAASTPSIAAIFLAAARGGNILGVSKLSQEMTPGKAREEWFGLTWRDRFDRLAKWAQQGDVDAHVVVSTIEEFKNSNSILYETLIRVLEEIAAPAWKVRSTRSLEALYSELERKGYLLRSKLEPPHSYKLEASEGWLVPPRFLLAQLGWRYVTGAKWRVDQLNAERAKFAERLENLRQEGDLSEEPGEEGLHHLLQQKGEWGMVISDRGFREGDTFGFFAVRLERTKKGKFVIKGWATTNQLLVLPDLPPNGRHLPDELEINEHDGSLRIRFGELEGLEPDSYKAFRAVERLMKARLSEEKRASAALSKLLENVDKVEEPAS